MHSISKHQLSFRPDLQGLRAVAVILVILHHSGLDIVPGGFIGVDIFFVISGFLITSLLIGELENTGKINLIEFYTRRFKRLLPALMFVLCISLAAALLLLSDIEIRKQMASFPYAATWTSNFYFALASIDYFNELGQRDLFMHTWSLGVEEQFYLVWPVLLLCICLLARSPVNTSRSLTKLIHSGTGCIFIASLSLSIYLTATYPLLAFYMMPARIWQLSLGALIFLLFRHKKNRGGRSVPVLLLASGLILVLGSATGLHTSLAYPGYLALIPTIGTALIIIAGQNLLPVRLNPLTHPILVWIGDRSYSLYLWHWPIIAIGFSLGMQGDTLLTVNLILLGVMASTFSYRYIELPFWKGRYSQSGYRTYLISSLFIMVTVVSGINLILYKFKQEIPGNSQQADIPVIYRMNCDAWYLHSRIEPCVFGQETAPQTVAFVGDSHGAQWFSIMPAIFPEPDWRLIVLTKSSCPLIDEDFFYARIGQIYQVCTDWRNAVLDELDKLKPDILVIGSAASYDFSETQWIEGSARVFERLGEAANLVIVIPGTPSLGFDGPGCLSRHQSATGEHDMSACQSSEHLYNTARVKEYLEQAAGRFTNVKILNLNDLVCPEQICNAISSANQLVFRDSQHLADSFVRSRIPVIRQRIELLITGNSGE